MKYSSTEICKLANVTKKALRHYHKIDLLSPALIDDNGYWYYNEKELESIQLIKNLQVIGYSLKEIKTLFDSDFTGLRKSIPEKLEYIDEQIIQLELAKRLLNKLVAKESLNPYEAITESMDEEHMEWYKNNLPPDQFNLVLKMMENPESMIIHEKLIDCLYKLKPIINENNSFLIEEKLEKIRSLFKDNNLDKNTIDKLIESFLKSNLEGPLSRRILNVKEVVSLLRHMN